MFPHDATASDVTRSYSATAPVATLIRDVRVFDGTTVLDADSVTRARRPHRRSRHRAFALPERGRIAPGLRADLLLVAGDPTRDITASAEIVGIWRRGHRFDREAHRADLDPASNE